MALITIDSGSFCLGQKVADTVADRLGYTVFTDDEVFSAVSDRFSVGPEKLRRTMYGGGSFFYSWNRDKVRNVAYLRSGFAEFATRDANVYSGLGAHLFPRSLTHVLKICLGGSRAFRLAEAANRGFSRREAERLIRKDDETRAEWIGFLHDRGPWDKSLYDVFLPMQKTSLDEAVETICDLADLPALTLTEQAMAATEDFRLASRVNVAVAEAGHDVDVVATGGHIEVLIKKHAMFLERVQTDLAGIALGVDGVKEATARPGPLYREPGISFGRELEIPSKVLLVDDERDFVHTLSERLQARSMTPTVAYDGEEALAYIESDEPEVMVLDLKMPGIDGIEVLRRVKKTHPATEVIILTGHGSDAEEKLAEEIGAFAYLRKPVDIEVLAETMKAAYRKVQRAGSADLEE